MRKLSPLAWSNYGRACFYFLILLTISLATVKTRASTQQNEPILSSTEIAQLNNTIERRIQQKAENVVDLLASKKFRQVRNALHPNLRINWPASKIEKIWRELLTETGSFIERDKSRVIKTVNGDLVFVSVEFENTTDELLVSFNQYQQIVGIDFPKVETIEQIAEKVVDALAKRDFASARGYLHPFLKTEIFPQQVEDKWEKLLLETGSFRKRLKTQTRNSSSVDNMDVVLVTVNFEKVTDNLIVIFDNDKRIIGIDFPILE